MEYLGTIENNCQNDVAHTGIGDCNKKRGKIIAILVTASNAMFPIEKTEFISNLSKYVTQEGNLRMFPITDIIANTPAGGDVNVPEAGFSGPTPTNLNAFSMIYQPDGGDCLLKELKKFNKRKIRVFEIDDEMFIYGTIIKKGGKDYFAGYDGRAYAWDTKTDGSTPSAINFGVWFGAKYENEQKNMHAFEISEVPTGLIGVTLAKGSGAGTVKVVALCDGEDYTSIYADDWTANMFVNKAGGKPTNVVYANGELTITPAGSYRLASASVLGAADIIGLEGADVYIDLT